MQALTKEIDGEIHLSSVDTPPEGAARGLALVRELLSAARAGGCLQTEVAETVLALGTGSRAIEVAQTVCSYITLDEVTKAFQRAGFNLSI